MDDFDRVVMRCDKSHDLTRGAAGIGAGSDGLMELLKLTPSTA